MMSELEVLELIGMRLDAAGISFMLTGSFAMSYYATPRMTRDLDIVVQLAPSDAAAIGNMFSADFYVDEEDVKDAIATERMFNMMHLGSGIKVDFILCKRSTYRQLEFSRRMRVDMEGFRTWIVSCEDLILSKLLWSLESHSELQLRDVRNLLATSPLDVRYLRQWASRLGVADSLEDSLR